MATISKVDRHLYQFGPFQLDPRKRQLFRQTELISLTPKVIETLLVLVENRERVVTKDELMKQLWPDSFVEESNLSQNIFTLRKALGDSTQERRYILTVPGRGYQFVAPVEQLEVAGPTSGSHSAVEFLVGKKISHYRVLQMLGGGGMGVVYKAEDLKLGRQVAMKFLPSEMATDPKAFNRMQDEARAASALDHPNICTVYELGEHDGQPFIVMQLLEGRTLREWIESATDSPISHRLSQVVNLALQILDGLGAAHDKGIVHRDIKPANIFVTNRGQIKILDFGVAKFLGGNAVNSENSQPAVGCSPSNPSLTKSGASVGTPSYLSPEQIRGEPLDARTDLFSVGAVLYEMATGQKAFAGSTVTQIQDAVLLSPLRPSPNELPVPFEAVIIKATEKDPELRYQTASQLRDDLQVMAPRLPQTSQSIATHPANSSTRTLRWLIAAACLTAVVVGLGLFGYYSRQRRAKQLTASDKIVLADFVNSTGDPIFDDTLKQALTLTLKQSPFLNILSQSKVRNTLKLMTRDKNTPLSPDIAAEVCQRAGSKAYVSGAIAALGSEYVIGLKAVNCQSGDILAQEQVTAAKKENILDVLGNAAAKLRGELGESLSTVEKYDVPLAEATTPSLEALKAYSQGYNVWLTRGEAEAIPYFKHAVELDPNFALAYVALGTVYDNLTNFGLAVESMSKAYELRDHASEHERFHILGHYYKDVTGEIEKAIPVYEQWERTYPSEPTPHTNLGNLYLGNGRFDEGLAQHLGALKVEPNSVIIYENLALTYSYLNRFDEAKATVQQAFARNLDDPILHVLQAVISGLQGDGNAMQQQLTWGLGKPGIEDAFVAQEAEIVASMGQFKKARELSRRAVTSAVQSGSKESAAYWQVQAALHEVEVGNFDEARRQAEAALSLSSSRETRVFAAVVLARARDNRRAQQLADELDRTAPLNTLLQRYWLPSIRAAIAIGRGDGAAALNFLQPAEPYALGAPMAFATLCPLYLRGQALLLLHQGPEATKEFQTVLDHPALTLFTDIPLANLQLGRAYVISGEIAKAKKAYGNFLASWKDADSDLAILRAAKSEYAQLH